MPTKTHHFLPAPHVPWCDEHSPKRGGAFAECLACHCRELSRALSDIDMEIDPHPEPMMGSYYDTDCNPAGVVDRVKRYMRGEFGVRHNSYSDKLCKILLERIKDLSGNQANGFQLTALEEVKRLYTIVGGDLPSLVADDDKCNYCDKEAVFYNSGDRNCGKCKPSAIFKEEKVCCDAGASHQRVTKDYWYNHPKACSGDDCVTVILPVVCPHHRE